MIYTVSDLIKKYGSRTVLDIPDLSIEGEQIYALLGANGAGKTTLLNILGLLEAPTTGRIQYRGRPLSFAESDLLPLRKEVVLVNQHPILFTTTVFKNIEFGLKIRKVDKKERLRIIEESLDLVGMQEFSGAPAQHLSGGETQRVAIARALALSPRVFLCDEPTSSVDVENQNIIITILRRINETKRISVLFTTHDRSQAARLAHHTIVLNQGRLVPTLYENIFRGVLLTDPSGQPQCVIQDKMHLSIGAGQLIPDRKAVTVFIDPEKITVRASSEDPAAANEIQGRVVQVIAENGKVRIVVDAGIWIALLISKKRYQKIGFMVGETIGLSIPPGAIQIM